MQVEMSLEELLINAIAHDRIPGVQFKRGWDNDGATFDGLRAVIQKRLDGAAAVARESARYQFDEERGTTRLRTAEAARDAYKMLAEGRACVCAAYRAGGSPKESVFKKIDKAKEMLVALGLEVVGL